VCACVCVLREGEWGSSARREPARRPASQAAPAHPPSALRKRPARSSQCKMTRAAWQGSCASTRRRRLLMLLCCCAAGSLSQRSRLSLGPRAGEALCSGPSSPSLDSSLSTLTITFYLPALCSLRDLLHRAPTSAHGFCLVLRLTLQLVPSGRRAAQLVLGIGLARPSPSGHQSTP
jgi:hypothetical protein